MPIPSAVQASSVQRRVATIQRSSVRPESERAHRERERDRQADVAEVEQRRVDHHVRVLQARVEAGAVERARPARRTGSRRTTSRNAKKVATPPSTGHRPGQQAAGSGRGSASPPSEPSAVRTSSQSSSDPSWPPQNAVHGVRERQLARGVVGDVGERKSRALKASRRTSAATAVAAKAPTSALRADSWRRRRPP